jgi:hypothetical protein
MNATTCLSLIAGASVAFTAAAETLQSRGLSADETRAMVAEMMADAQSNSSFSSMPGWDTASTVNVSGAFQFRYIANFGDDVDADDIDPDVLPEGVTPGDLARDDFDSGFQFGSNVINLSGTIGDDEAFGYYVRGNFDFDGGAFSLDDAYFTYDLGNNWELMGGQMKVPFLREELIDDFYQLTVDRSVVNETFTADRTQGIAVKYQDDSFRVWGVFSDGARSRDTDFTDDAEFSFTDNESDVALTARAEFKGAGAWDQFEDFTSAPGSEFAWLVGGALHWENGEDADDDDYDGIGWTLDAQLEGNGWNAYAAYVGIFQDSDADDFDEDVTNHGFVVQGGVMIPDTDWELFGRYDITIPDSEFENDDPYNVLTFGGNYYIHGHAAKFTVDVQWAFDAASDNDLILLNAVGDRFNRIGLIGNEDDDEIALRGQLQLMY